MCSNEKDVKKKPVRRVPARIKHGDIKKSPNLNMVRSPIDDIKYERDHFSRNYLGVASLGDWD